MEKSFKFSFIFVVLGTVFPLFAALHSIQISDKERSLNWLCYFCIYEIWEQMEMMLFELLYVIPGYDVTRLLLLVAVILWVVGYAPKPMHVVIANCLSDIGLNMKTWNQLVFASIVMMGVIESTGIVLLNLREQLLAKFNPADRLISKLDAEIRETERRIEDIQHVVNQPRGSKVRVLKTDLQAISSKITVPPLQNDSVDHS